MKKGQKQLLTSAILALLVNIILCEGFLTGVNYETGIKTLILKDVPHEFHDDASSQLSFQIAFQTSYGSSPLPIVSLVGFGRPVEGLQTNYKNKYLSIKIVQLIALPKGIKIKVQSTLMFGTIKVSYLFIDQFLAEKNAIGLINYPFPQNQKLNRDKGSYLKVNQYKRNASEPQIKDKINEYYSLLPMNSQDFNIVVCLNEIRLMSSSYSNHNLNIFYQNSQISLIYSQKGLQQTSINQLPKYLLVVFGKEKGEKNILIEIITVSISDEPVSKEGQNNMHFFMGIKGIDVKGGMLSIDNLLFKNRSSFNGDILSGENIEITLIKILDSEIKQTRQLQKDSRRMLIACTVPLYSTIYQNYWTTGKNPVKGSVETCQPCPTGCYTCAYCSSCLRYVNCTLCNLGFTFIKLGIDDYPATQMVCRCPTGLFPNATTNTCMNCTSVIPYCTSCISKQSGHFSAACSSCTTGLFPVPNTGSWGGAVQCGLCVYGCTACSSATVCTTCGNGLKAVTGGGCACSSANTFYNSITLTCAACPLVIPNCLTCTSNSTTTLCSVCVSGFFSTVGQCTPCPVNCNNCTSTNCFSCASTFISSGNICVCNQTAQMFLNITTNKCITCGLFISSCIDCNQTSGVITCLACVPGTYLDLGSCLQCPSALCTTCGAGGVCISCTSNLIVIGPTCGCDINAGSYLNVATSTCVLCSSYFPSCTSCIFNTTSTALQCIACSSGYYLDIGSVCLVCPATCGNCTSPTNCLDCAPGYQLNSSTLCQCINCVTCSSLLLNNCSDCQTTAPIACTLCEIGFYLLLPGGTCQPCPVGCVSCSNNSFCGSCNLPFISTIPAGSCVCNSLNLYYFDPLLLTCSTCNTIILSCLSCISIGNSTSCLDCGLGMYINSNICLNCIHPCSSCSSASTCITCVSNYILVNGSCVCDSVNQQFENLGVTCVLCHLITVSTCLLCQADPLAVATQGVKCSTCAAGYFPDNFLCSQCPPTCSSCYGLTNCTFCQNTYSLIGGICTCDTSVSYFAHEGICMPCFAIINYCLSCSNSTSIVLCVSCQIGTFLSMTQDSCILCPINCDICTSSSVCSVCSAGYTKSLAGVCQCLTTCSSFPNADPSCISCNLQVDAATNSTSLLCLACKTGTFLYQNQTCSPCPITCTTCSTFSNCLVCEPSFQLVNGQCTCNTFFGQILFGSTCQTCMSLIPGCTTCIIVLGIAQCSACSQGWGIDGIQCIFCGTGCLSCTIVASLVATCDSCTVGFTPSGSSCLPIMANTCISNQYFVLASSTCINCSPKCLSCFDTTGCVLCDLTFSNVEGQCVCDEGLSLFYDITLGYCVTCLSNANLINCKRCQSSTANFINGIQCLDCLDGFFLSNGICTACSNGCLKCTGGASCYSCLIPAWTMVNGTCACNNDLSYFVNGTSCSICSIQHCSICNSLNTCLLCNFNYFINISGLCEKAVCNDSSTQGVENCDDGNLINGDGCSQNCTIETYYFCDNSLGASVCVLDSRFNVQLSSIASACNQILISFRIVPFYTQYDVGNYDGFLRSHNSTHIVEQSYQRQYDIITYTFKITKTVQDSEINFVFDPTTLGVSSTFTYPLNQLNLIIQPSNNMLAIYYEQQKCNQAQTMQALTNIIEYATYGIMALSVLPCKIVGLEASGVIQLAFFSIASMDDVNVLLSPMKGLKGINGYALSIGQSSNKRLLQTTPQRVSSIGYSSNFIRNCNVMLLIVGGIIFISLILYCITFLFKNCSPCLHSASKRLIKQVLLTLILFNCFNFAYSVGLHFKYASTNDDIYVLGTIAAISALIIPIIMAVALATSSEDGFGQFKDKLKNGCVQKGYFVVTIAYRSCLGLYMSSSNEDHLSTLIVLAASIAFLLYNLINLPFVKAYHNYRANICHICQFICLFIAMYYRSMNRSHDPNVVSNIDSPVYIQYACICVSLAVSIVVLAYEGYIWVRQCKKTQRKPNSTKIMNNSQQNIINHYKQHTLKSLDDEKAQDSLIFTNE